MTKKEEQQQEYDKIIADLLESRADDAHRWAIFFLGSQLSIGKTKLYRKRGMALHKLKESVSCLDGNGPRSKIIDGLMERNFIEIRQLCDRNPRFPYTIKGITKEQADKLTSMTDSPDEEMVKVALRIMEELTKDK